MIDVNWEKYNCSAIIWGQNSKRKNNSFKFMISSSIMNHSVLVNEFKRSKLCHNRDDHFDKSLIYISYINCSKVFIFSIQIIPDKLIKAICWYASSWITLLKTCDNKMKIIEKIYIIKIK